MEDALFCLKEFIEVEGITRFTRGEKHNTGGKNRCNIFDSCHRLSPHVKNNL